MQLPCRRLRRPRRVLRQWPAASCSATIGFAAAGVSQPATPGNASPAAATASVAATASASIKDSNLSRRAPRVLGWSREAAALPRSGCWSMPPVLTVAAHPGASAPRPPRQFKRHGGSVPLMPVHLPGELQECASIAEDGTSDAGGLPGRRALHAGFPPAVRSPGLSALPPTIAAQGGYESGSGPYHAGTKAAPPPRV